MSGPVAITVDELAALIAASSPKRVLHTSYGRTKGSVLYVTPDNRWALIELARMRNVDLTTKKV